MPAPIYKAIPYQSPQSVFSLFSDDNWAIWLDSADADHVESDRSRYSYIAVDPFETLVSRQGQLFCNDQPIAGEAFSVLKEKLAFYRLDRIAELPALQTGALGYWAYDLCHYLEPVPFHREHDEIKPPEMAIGFYDIILAFDHQMKQAWIIASGFPEKTGSQHLKRAEARIQAFVRRLREVPSSSEVLMPIGQDGGASHLRSNFSQEAYQQTIKRVIDYIKEGDIFEANLSQRFSLELTPDFKAYTLYTQLRRLNPAPFSAFMRIDDCVIASSSPERFIQLHDGQAETRPIKGTRSRGSDAESDREQVSSLLNSQKDRAENIMIVDLMRNDFSKVCIDTSVNVTQLCALESFEQVHHLVSAIKGRLRQAYTAVDLLKACFPAGSITGAPKVRAMQIIAELEPHARGIYCGSLGYISMTGDMDTSVVIRTYVMCDKQLSFHGGGAIVLDSKPEEEYRETLVKVAALKMVLEGV